MGIEKIINFIATFWEFLIFWHICKPWEGGVMLRLGAYARNLHTGFNWKWPILEMATECNITPTSAVFLPTIAPSAEGHNIIYTLVLLYQVVDVKKFLIDIESADDILNAAGRGIVTEQIMNMTDTEIFNPDFPEKCLKALRKKGWKWGIEVQDVNFAMLTRPSLREGIILIGATTNRIN